MLSKTTRLAAIAVLSAGSLGALAACSPAGDQNGPGQEAGASDQAAQASAPAEKPKAAAPKAQHKDFGKSTNIADKPVPVDPEQAVAAAREYSGGGELQEMKLSYDRLYRTWAYQVRTVNGRLQSQAVIDAISAKALDHGSQQLGKKEKVGTVDDSKTVSYDKALHAATSQTDGSLIRWDLSTEDSPTYTFELDQDGAVHSVAVDAHSGKVRD
ncbi:PepSY domain-containing protein [Brevibacterium moorei]|uniref:PepSY domain-containing protein n=1 Tax=Brevibacterium moorei TaxID=2968457 RepID=UPI00211CADCC|nr:PepSY domain-containing protein [Brevibacterium sp. 68QC2CO]MCQ9384260.1 PepSY domain-containing protein [Brevibacterium sp. 68QC2CO]